MKIFPHVPAALDGSEGPFQGKKERRGENHPNASRADDRRGPKNRRKKKTLHMKRGKGNGLSIFCPTSSATIGSKGEGRFLCKGGGGKTKNHLSRKTAGRGSGHGAQR